MSYASTCRVMFTMLALTGCRLSEMDNMKQSYLKDGWLWWRLGKNQKNYRKVKLPDPFIQELKDYRESHRVPSDSLFGVEHRTFRRYFNRTIRKLLGGGWIEKTEALGCNGFTEEYLLQLKGLRKSYQTLLFKAEYEKWGDPGVALQFTSKAMRHSSERITAYHYLVNFDTLGNGNHVIEDICKMPLQTSLVEFI